MKDAPKGLRLHIAVLGRCNVGKSSLLNALCGQDVAIVSATPGTTADPVEKTLEMAPLGPVVFLDTAGTDDTGELGGLRAGRSLAAMTRADLALLVTDSPSWGPYERDLAARLKEQEIPFVAVRNKADQPGSMARPQGLSDEVPFVCVSAYSGQGLDAVRAALMAAAPEGALRQPPLASDLLPDKGVLVLVTPIDSGAPRGRLILPQVQTIRDSLDGRKICLVVTEAELPAALRCLKKAPDLVVCDSQVVHAVDRHTPGYIPMTTFSILMARFKSDLTCLVQGAATLRKLRSGDSVLIQEACSHHAQKDDIGRVKLPRLLQKMAGGGLRISIAAGKEFSGYSGDCKAVVHCGGCVITRGQMMARLHAATRAGLPITNYGVAISLAQGVLPRVLAPFPEALRAYEDACCL